MSKMHKKGILNADEFINFLSGEIIIDKASIVLILVFLILGELLRIMVQSELTVAQAELGLMHPGPSIIPEKS